MRILNKICTAASCLARRNCTCRSWRPQMRTWRAWAGAGRLLSSRMSCISVKSQERLAQSAILSPGPKAIPEIAVKAEQLDEPLAKRWLKWVGPEKGGWDEKLVAHLSLKNSPNGKSIWITANQCCGTTCRESWKSSTTCPTYRWHVLVKFR